MPLAALVHNAEWTSRKFLQIYHVIKYIKCCVVCWSRHREREQIQLCTMKKTLTKQLANT